MSNVNNHNSTRTVSRVFTETKASFKTTEFWVFILVSVAILIAAAVTDQSDDGDGQKFGAAQAWSYVALTSVGYMISRGLAKAGTKGRERHSDDDR